MILGSSVALSLAGPFVAACGLLVVAGIAKVAKPDPGRLAARAAGIRAPRAVVVTFGLFEVGIGLSGAVVGGAAALGVAACYVVLTFVAVRLLQRAPATPCACLGSSTAVVTRTHVAVDVAATALAIATATGASPWSQLPGHWVEGAVFVVLAATCVKLAVLALEALPQLATATREGAG